MAERHLFASEAQDKLTLEAQTGAYATVQRLQDQIIKAREKRDALAFAIADSGTFISSLEHKLHALNDAGSVAEYVHEMRFEACPACLAPLNSVGIDRACHLCKTPFESEQTKGRIVALINDTSLQLKQSESLQVHRTKEIQKLSEDVLKLEGAWKEASTRLAELRKLPTGAQQEALRDLHRRGGYLEREIEDLETKSATAQLVDQLSKIKADLNAQISELRVDNEVRHAAQSKRLARAYTSIADEVRHLLRHDLRRQDTFENPQSIEFDFGANRITVDGESYFSASSRVILKSSFFAGFLAAATKEAFFRHPRFCIIDTIEDKGMEPIRSHNFQIQIAENSKSVQADHQVIFATAMIAPDLDDETYTVGKYSTRDDPTLVIPD